MSTVNKSIADDVIAGKYPEDDVVRIVKYHNAFNNADAYGLIMRGQDLMGYHKSVYCRNPEIYWEAAAPRAQDVGQGEQP